MKQTVLISYVMGGLIGFCICATGQTAVTNAVSSGPRISFAEPNFNFGKVDAGMAVKHDFIFTNTGDQLLTIKDVHPSCGCTTAGSYDKEVAPGQVGKISIQFNSSGYSGTVSKTITVTCNDPRTTLYLRLDGAVWRAFEVIPTYAVFNMMPEQQTNQTQVVRIVSNNDEPVTVSDPTCASPAFKLELTTVKPGKEFELRVTADASHIIGNASSSVTLKTSSEKMPTISLMAFAMVQPLVSVNPPQIALAPGPLPNPVKMTMTVQNNSTNAVTLSEPKINADGVTVQVSERQPGRQFNLIADFPQGFQSKPGQNIQLTVKSSNPKYPLIIIPVIQPMPATIPVPVAPATNVSAINHHP